jgi:hypothetical protein
MEIQEAWPQYFGKVWEQIARDSLARIKIANQRWLPAGRWWGPGMDDQPLELDIVSAHPKNRNLCLSVRSRQPVPARNRKRCLDS